MLASQLLTLLEESIVKHGDWPVRVGTRDDTTAEVAGILFDPETIIIGQAERVSAYHLCD